MADFLFAPKEANKEDVENFLQPKQNETVLELKPEHNLLDLLVICGIFSSKSEAKRNWKGEVKIKSGYSEFRRLGKHRHNIFIFERFD